MNNQDPLDRLAEFYRTLDAIPTPPLALQPPPRRRYLVFFLAPIGASLLAYGFLACCAYMPVKPSSVPRFPLAIDRLAAEEIKADASSIAHSHHASIRESGGNA